MKIQHVDELFISQPMSQDERFKLLKSLQEHSFLQGIDKGTLLERDTATKLKSLKQQKATRKFKDLMDRFNDYINVGVKRHKRAKYKGRYNKKKKYDGSPVSTNPTIIITNLPSWLT